jgi:hypothetical protein
MGQHVWLLLATIITELLVIIKWSRGLFTEPMPGYIKVFLSTLAVLLVAYPAGKVSAPLIGSEFQSNGIISSEYRRRDAISYDTNVKVSRPNNFNHVKTPHPITIFGV